MGLVFYNAINLIDNIVSLDGLIGNGNSLFATQRVSDEQVILSLLGEGMQLHKVTV